MPDRGQFSLFSSSTSPDLFDRLSDSFAKVGLQVVNWPLATVPAGGHRRAEGQCPVLSARYPNASKVNTRQSDRDECAVGADAAKGHKFDRRRQSGGQDRARPCKEFKPVPDPRPGLIFHAF
jgi:hypothetical protein